MLTPERIQQLAFEHLKAFAQFTGSGDVWFEGEDEFARAVEAATLATVTPLVQQMQDALVAAYPELNGLAVMSDTALELAKQHAKAITAARAFLSGATKESNHG